MPLNVSSEGQEKSVRTSTSLSHLVPGLVVWGGLSACVYLGASQNVPDFMRIPAGFITLFFAMVVLGLPLVALGLILSHGIGVRVLWPIRQAVAPWIE